MGQLPKNTRRADYIGIWWTLLGPGGVLVTIFSGIIGFFEPIARHGWAAVVLAGFGAAGLLILIASAGLVAWRYFRPLPSAPTAEISPASVPQSNGLSEDAVSALIASRLEEFLSTTLRAEFAPHSDIHARDVKIAEISDRIKSVRASLETLSEYLSAKHKDMDGRFDRMVSFAENLSRETDDRFSWVDGGFSAIWHREQMAAMEAKLIEQARMLLRPKGGVKVEHWGEWSHQKSLWEGLLKEWVTMAEPYCPDLSQKVLLVPHDRLIGDWSEPDSLFPSADAINAYRAVSVMFDNFQTWRPQVHRSTEVAAFMRPSMKSPRVRAEDR